MIHIRRAAPADASVMSSVLIDSITELCAADHKDDPAAIASWLSNKSPDRIAEWFENPANTLLVAQCDREVAAVGGFNASRMIILNYVSPNHRFAGVSKALLAAMEEALGPGEATLDSTLTARPFYLAAGWLEVGPPKAYRMVDGYPMRKMLS